MKEPKINILYIKPGKHPEQIEVDNTLESFQKLVGGSIECTYPYEEYVGLVCNEEGKLLGLPLNRALHDDDNNIYDIVAGSFFIAGCSMDGNFRSLTDVEINKFSKLFKNPELFYHKANGSLVVLPVISSTVDGPDWER